MDAVVIYILLGFIVVAGFIWTVFGVRWRQQLREKGKDAGFALDDIMKKGDAGKLGTSLVIPNGQAGAQKVTEVFAQTKRIIPIDGSRWHYRYIQPDDLTIVWSIDANGQGILYVEEAHEALGQLVGGGDWAKLIKNIEKQLDGASLAHQRQAGELQKTERNTATNDGVWGR